MHVYFLFLLIIIVAAHPLNPNQQLINKQLSSSLLLLHSSIRVFFLCPHPFFLLCPFFSFNLLFCTTICQCMPVYTSWIMVCTHLHGDHGRYYRFKGSCLHAFVLLTSLWPVFLFLFYYLSPDIRFNAWFTAKQTYPNIYLLFRIHRDIRRNEKEMQNKNKKKEDECLNESALYPDNEPGSKQ